MSIWVSGDTHGDFRRFTTDNFYEQKEMTEKDHNYLIITGDFGGVWSNSREENYWLDWINNKPFQVLFCDGNHGNYDLLDSYPVSEWHGGKVHFIRPSVIHLCRGQVFTIENKTFFTFGGASSHDIEDGILDPNDYEDMGEFRRIYNQWRKQNKMFRVRGVSWWDKELPSQEEMDEGIRNLEKSGNNVDFIITHCCPQQVASIFSMGKYKPDILTQYFNGIAENTEFSKWLFGHYHDNKQIMSKFIMLYEQIIRVL